MGSPLKARMVCKTPARVSYVSSEKKKKIIFIIKTQLRTMAMQLHRGWTHPGHSRTKKKISLLKATNK